VSRHPPCRGRAPVVHLERLIAASRSDSALTSHPSPSRPV
jgi:hypothetical protein